MGPFRGVSVQESRDRPCPSPNGTREWAPTPESRTGPAWAGCPGRKPGCRSGEGWMVREVVSSWGEGRCEGSWFAVWRR